MEIFQKKSKLFGVAPMYVSCDNPGFIAGPKYVRVCHYKKYGGVKTYIQYTYDTRN